MYYNIINMNLDSFVNYIISNKNNCEIIKLDQDIDLLKLQTYLCKKLINSFLFINYYDKYYDNIIYHNYNNNIYGIVKKDINIFYIWKIKI
jgi:hypothetical protein